VLAANLNAARTVSWPARFGIEELHEFPGESSAGEDLGGQGRRGLARWWMSNGNYFLEQPYRDIIQRTWSWD